MSRGRGEIGSRVYQGQTPIALRSNLEISKINALLGQTRAWAPDQYLSGLTPGQTKISELGIRQLKILEDLGRELDQEILRIQQTYYGDALAEAKQVLKEAKLSKEKADQRFNEVDKEEIDTYKKHGLEARYHEHWEWELEKDEERRRPYKDWDYNVHEFDPVRYKQAAKSVVLCDKARRKTNEAHTAKRLAKEEIGACQRHYESVFGATYNQGLIRVLSEIRGLGGADEKKLSILHERRGKKNHSVHDDREIRRWVRAAERFPSDWLDEMISYQRQSKRKLTIGSFGGLDSSAHYQQVNPASQGPDAYDAIRWDAWRLEAVGADHERLVGNALHSVLVHEMMHHMEVVKPELARVGNGYRVWRSQEGDELSHNYARTDYRKKAQKELRDLKKKDPVAYEKAISENTLNLNSHLNWGHSEVLSTGIENMVPGASSHASLDARHRAFVLGCLAAL